MQTKYSIAQIISTANTLIYQHYTLCAQVFLIARIRQVEVYCKTFNKCVNLIFLFLKKATRTKCWGFCEECNFAWRSRDCKVNSNGQNSYSTCGKFLGPLSKISRAQLKMKQWTTWEFQMLTIVSLKVDAVTAFARLEKCCRNLVKLFLLPWKICVHALKAGNWKKRNGKTNKQ